MLEFLEMHSLTPKKFWPYTSTVTQRLIEMRAEHGKKTDEDYLTAKQMLITMFKQAGIKAYEDNKIVFECDLKGHTVYIGFYDWTMSIGFGIWSDHQKD